MIIINESNKFTFTRDEVGGIISLIGDDARAGIVEASAIRKKLMNSNTIDFTGSELGYLSYWDKLLKEYPNSPKSKYMSKESKDAIKKIFSKVVNEDTVKKSNGKWTNRGKEGEHGEFDSKEKADAQRKAMFANGYKG